MNPKLRLQVERAMSFTGLEIWVFFIRNFQRASREIRGGWFLILFFRHVAELWNHQSSNNLWKIMYQRPFGHQQPGCLYCFRLQWGQWPDHVSRGSGLHPKVQHAWTGPAERGHMLLACCKWLHPPGRWRATKNRYHHVYNPLHASYSLNERV